MSDLPREQCGRLLRLWLRHKPEQAEIVLEGDGWAPVSGILVALERAGLPMAGADLAWFVRSEPEHAFEIEGDRIRARSGHSVELAPPAHRGMPPAALYGAVPARYADRTDVVGLAPRKQRFIHLHTDRAGAREASSRRDQDPVLFRIAAHEAHEAGVQFYPRGEGIWLSDPIPPAFLTRLVDDGGEGERRAKRLARPGDPGYRRRRPRGGFAKPRERNSHG